MIRCKVFHYLLCLVLFSAIIVGLAGDRVALAAQEGSGGSYLLPPNQEEPPPEEKLELRSLYPVLRDISGSTFEFEVELNWVGSEAKRFDLTTTVPSKWRALVLRAYEEKEAPAIELEPNKEFADSVRVRIAPLSGELPEPGEYTVTLTASSGIISESIELTAIVTELYRFAFYTASEKLNTEATAGKESHITLIVFNTGTAPIGKVSFTSSKPSGWNVTFNPEDLENVDPGMAQEVDVVIKPPGKTIAGDYMLTMSALPRDVAIAKRELDIRVTALTPTIWGWVGIIIVLAVIAGVGILFRRLGRR